MTSHAHAPGWEHQALDSIKSALGDSDPKLAAQLAVFGQLASSEAMPGHEKIRSALRHPPQRRRRTRTPHRRLGPQRAAVLIWLLASVALITVAAILSHGGPASCPHALGICGGLWSSEGARSGCQVPSVPEVTQRRSSVSSAEGRSAGLSPVDSVRDSPRASQTVPVSSIVARKIR
jgi:hypothetical protein